MVINSHYKSNVSELTSNTFSMFQYDPRITVCFACRKDQPLEETRLR